MNERIDHAAESERINDMIGEDFISDEGWTDTTAILAGIDTLRHAVLALVEQQRIANLLALLKPEDPRDYDCWPDIAAALGLDVEEARSCRACGCTDGRACFPSCWWVEPDLCSSCAPASRPRTAYRECFPGCDCDGCAEGVPGRDGRDG